ncbi:unnamed protein product [Lactuca virosa]|uniref:Uncharacterized protein n=1 Tax=Lactuca virosa TaxID=75947 RepID=A0AAU9P4C8_9ASTR|nr:unnamed protein product [Lactuca virosa]
MPEKSHPNNNGKAVESIEPHQSAWLTHWTGTRFESSTHVPSTRLIQNEEDDLDMKKHSKGVEIASDSCGSSKGINDLELAMSLKKPGSSSRECHFQPEEASQIPSEQVKYHMFFGESRTTHGPENISQLKTIFTSKNHLPKTNSVAMEQEHKMPSFLRQDNVALLKTDPSTSSNSAPSLIAEQYKRMHKHIGMGFFPHQSCPEVIKPGTMQSFQNVSHLEGLHSFSRTTHSVLITKQTDVKVYQEKQIFRESMVSTRLKEEAVREVNRSPAYFADSQRGVKLQLLESSDQESQEKIEDVKGAGDVQKNESSADTDTMDMESFKENHLSGVHFSPLNKVITMESNIPILPLSKPKDTHRKRKMELPDINLEISSLPASSSSTEKEKSSRWIKRLKLTGSGGSGLLRKTTPQNKLFTKVNVGPPSETVIGESSDRHNNNCNNNNNNKEVITLSNAWIQRWSSNQGQKSPVVERIEKGDCKVGPPEEYEKKQFPSIAAMALMGKAMSGFQQCKFQKRESFMVWNTKGFE